MLKKCVLSLLILVPSYSNAIKDNTAYGVTATAGLFGAWFGKALANEHSSHSGDALVGAAIFGAAGAGLTYWYLRDKMPAARLEKATQIIDDIKKKKLMRLAVPAQNVTDEFTTACNRKFSKQNFPLVAGANYFSKLLPEVKQARQLLKWARADASAEQTPEIDAATVRALGVQSAVQDRIIFAKDCPGYKAQQDEAHARTVEGKILELMSKGANAQQLAAEAAYINSQAQQEKAVAKQTDANAHAVDSVVGFVNMFNQKK